MSFLREHLWSLLFAAAVAVLMLSILLVRTTPVPEWVLLVYPLSGAGLALAASRTSPSVEQMAGIESGTIAAAAIVVLAALVNLLLADMILREIQTGALASEGASGQLVIIGLPLVAVLLWRALQRRLARHRRHSVERRAVARRQAAIPAE